MMSTKKKIEWMKKLEREAKAAQQKLDKIQNDWESLREEVNKDEKVIEYKFADVLA